MSKAQLKAHRKHNFTGQVEQVRSLIERNPGITVNRLAEKMTDLLSKDFPPGRVTARLADLKSVGCIIEVDGPETTYYYEPNPDKWPEIADRIQLIADCERITRFAKRYADRMDASTLEGLRRLFRKIQAA